MIRCLKKTLDLTRQFCQIVVYNNLDFPFSGQTRNVIQCDFILDQEEKNWINICGEEMFSLKIRRNKKNNIMQGLQEGEKTAVASCNSNPKCVGLISEGFFVIFLPWQFYH